MLCQAVTLYAVKSPDNTITSNLYEPTQAGSTLGL